MVFDENNHPGGQLLKQIHKFFGSSEHLAGVRGFDIGKKLFDKALSKARSGSNLFYSFNLFTNDITASK